MRRVGTGRHGVFAQAHCLWEGELSQLLLAQGEAWVGTERAACASVAGADEGIERERAAWLGRLTNVTGNRWQSHSWWEVSDPELDAKLAAVGAALPPGQLDAIVQTGRDQANALQQLMQQRMPSDLPSRPEDSPVQGVREKLQQAMDDARNQAANSPYANAAAATADLIHSLVNRNRGGGDPPPPPSSGAGAKPVASPWPPPPPAVPSPFVEPADNSGGVVAAVVITLLLVLGGGVGFVYYRKHTIRKAESDRRRMLSAEMSAQNGAAFVASPLQGFEPPTPTPAPTGEVTVAAAAL